ncbi:Phosphoenolpyruvate/phosphate translocator 2, partial [Durusdinium trenchii]
VLTEAPLPVVLTLVQFATAAAFGWVMLRLMGWREYVPLPERARPPFLRLTAVYTMGFLFVNCGYVVVNVSLAETLRSAEPLVTVMLAIFVLKTEPVSRLELLALGPIVLGGALSSLGDSSFSLLGLLFVTISNLSFSLRSMYTKQLRQVYNGDAFNVFFHVSTLGLVYLAALLAMLEMVPFACSLSGGWCAPPLRFFFLGNPELLLNAQVVQYFAINGLTYTLYNQTSFYVLSKVRMVTHGVANAFRRVVTILCSVWYFGNPINGTNAFGIFLAILGVVCYAKAKDLASS